MVPIRLDFTGPQCAASVWKLRSMTRLVQLKDAQACGPNGNAGVLEVCQWRKFLNLAPIIESTLELAAPPTGSPKQPDLANLQNFSQSVALRHSTALQAILFLYLRRLQSWQWEPQRSGW